MRVPSLQMSTARCSTPSGNAGRRCALVADDRSSTTATQQNDDRAHGAHESLPWCAE